MFNLQVKEMQIDYLIASNESWVGYYQYPFGKYLRRRQDL